MSTEAITLPESRQLISLESKIEAGRKTFVEVGLALAEIRDQRLYRADYETFDDYCKEKWNWDKSYCTRLIGAAEVSKTVPIGTIHNEAQARAIAQVPAAERPAIVDKVLAKGPLSARAIQEAIEVEKPPTLESQFKAATANLEIPADEPELTPFQEFEQDIAYICEKAIARIDVSEPGKCKLTLAVWIKKFTQAQKEAA